MKKILMIFVMMVLGCVNAFGQSDWNNMSAEDLFQLGLCYWRGDGVKANDKLSQKAFRMAADKGHAKAMSWVGASYWDNKKSGCSKAFPWYVKAVEAGDTVPENLERLAKCYQFGYGTSVNKDKALELYLRIYNYQSSEDDYNTPSSIEYLYHNVDNKKAIYYNMVAFQRYYDRHHEHGINWYNASHLYEIYDMGGYGVTPNKDSAFYWIDATVKILAESHGGCSNYYAKLHEEARAKCSNVQKYSFIMPVWKPAVESLTLAQLREEAHKAFDKGKYGSAMGYFQKAAQKAEQENDKDVAIDEYNAGLCNYKTEDYTTALRYYHKAAEKGYAVAANNIGYMYANGQGVSEDANQALEWYKKAWDLGDEQYGKPNYIGLKNRLENSTSTPQNNNVAATEQRKGGFWNGMLKALEVTSTVLEGASNALNEYNNLVGSNNGNTGNYFFANEGKYTATTFIPNQYDHKYETGDLVMYSNDAPKPGSSTTIGWWVDRCIICKGSRVCVHCNGNKIIHIPSLGERPCKACEQTGVCTCCHGKGYTVLKTETYYDAYGRLSVKSTDEDGKIMIKEGSDVIVDEKADELAARKEAAHQREMARKERLYEMYEKSLSNMKYKSDIYGYNDDHRKSYQNRMEELRRENPDIKKNANLEDWLKD